MAKLKLKPKVKADLKIGQIIPKQIKEDRYQRDYGSIVICLITGENTYRGYFLSDNLTDAQKQRVLDNKDFWEECQKKYQKGELGFTIGFPYKYNPKTQTLTQI